MAFDYLTNTPLEEALEQYIHALKASGFSHREEVIPSPKSAGRIASRPVYSAICAPHYTASAMDGIAVSASLTYGATATTPVILSTEQYIAVDTGDPIPEGADAVVMVEDIIREDNGDVKLYSSVAPWSNIRQIGEDICAGEMILSSYEQIKPSTVGAMLASGVLQVPVIRKPVVAVIPTGDEIVAPTDCPNPGDIMEFNSSIFSGMLENWGCVPKVYPIIKDRPECIKEALSKALLECDMLLINAGSSAGRDDWTTQCVSEIGQVICHGIAIKPGKPAILGIAGSKPILGVPGYPVSGIIVLEEIFKPLIDCWYHQPWVAKPEVQAQLSRSIVSGLKYKEYVRVNLARVGDRLIATPLSRGAGIVSSFMKADGIFTIAQGREGVEAGETIDVRLLRPMEHLERSVLAIGSHDPLIDELADMLHSADSSLFLRSTHVGSMGGIMAIKRGEAHLAGCHLLDETNGDYNDAYIRKYFPNGGVRLVECVGRTQGIMVAKGNPHEIHSFEDLARPGLRYVNRQKGSGTRVLTDYLLKKHSMDTLHINGYEREETTHTAVAAQIAAGSADMGMGIYSAARIYDLDFVPICTEQYDFIIGDFAWDLPQVQQIIEILKSNEFKERIMGLGGYTLVHPGDIRMKI